MLFQCDASIRFASLIKTTSLDTLDHTQHNPYQAHFHEINSLLMANYMVDYLEPTIGECIYRPSQVLNIGLVRWLRRYANFAIRRVTNNIITGSWAVRMRPWSLSSVNSVILFSSLDCLGDFVKSFFFVIINLP